jgi:hypothetical protein
METIRVMERFYRARSAIVSLTRKRRSGDAYPAQSARLSDESHGAAV